MGGTECRDVPQVVQCCWWCWDGCPMMLVWPGPLDILEVGVPKEVRHHTYQIKTKIKTHEEALLDVSGPGKR